MWDKVPTFCRFICVSTIAIYLISFVTMVIPGYLIAVPAKILY